MRRFVIAAALLAGSCASAPPPRPVALDPANPAAPEAPRLVVEPLPVSAPVPATKEEPQQPEKPAHPHEHGGSR
jgi:hypothetical protein